jgi:hypothetical protein
MSKITQVKKIIKWGGIPMGWVFQGVGIYYTTKDIAAAGLPAWAWYLIGTVMISASFISIIVGFYRENKTLRATLKTGSDIKLMEWRQEYRKPQISKVTNIPQTLNQMWKVVAGIMEERKKKHVPREKLLDMLVHLLQASKDDLMFNADSYSTPDKLNKLTKHLKAKMGLKKRDAKLEAEWRKRTALEMENRKIGLELDKSNDYTELIRQLNEDRVPITKSKVDHVIDDFIENLHAVYSIRLLLFYGGIGKNKGQSVFPYNVVNTLKRIEEAADKAMRILLRHVNDTLEEYSIGKEMNE